MSNEAWGMQCIYNPNQTVEEWAYTKWIAKQEGGISESPYEYGLSHAQLAEVLNNIPQFDNTLTKDKVRHQLKRYRESLSTLDVSVTKVKDVQEKSNKLLGEQILKLVKKAPISLSDLADAVDVSPKRVKAVLEELKAEHYLVDSDGYNVSMVTNPKYDNTVIDTSVFYNKTYKFGAIGDTHLGSKYARLDVLNCLYDIYEREGVKDVYLAGNYVDGECRYNTQDLLVHGMTNQIKYFIDNYPQREGITTKFIAGDDHEGWWQKDIGVNIGEYTEVLARKEGRTDLQYLGYMEHDIELQAQNGMATLRVIHAGGGSSYALSYTSQKILESYTGGEKPQILLIGHYHKSLYMPSVRNVHAVQVGCTQDQTPFMRKKRLAAHVGGWLCEVNLSPDGAISRFKAEWFPFFDREYTRNHWTYDKGVLDY